MRTARLIGYLHGSFCRFLLGVTFAASCCRCHFCRCCLGYKMSMLMCIFMSIKKLLKLYTLSCLSHMMTLPAGVDLGAFPTSFSSSLLDSSLLELSALGFAFLADGPFLVSSWMGGAFLFLASGDLGSTTAITLGHSQYEVLFQLILTSNGSAS